MIGTITGTPLDNGKDTLIITTTGGVGYAVVVSEKTKRSSLQKDSVTLFTHTLVRNDAIVLYGFLDQKEYAAFLLLISVPSIGPKKGVQILDNMEVDDLLHAIYKKDIDRMVESGIAKKQAEKIMLDLHTKVSPNALEDVGSQYADVLAAVIALGYDAKTAREAIKHIKEDSGDTSEQIQEVLRVINRNKVQKRGI